MIEIQLLGRGEWNKAGRGAGREVAWKFFVNNLFLEQKSPAAMPSWFISSATDEPVV